MNFRSRRALPLTDGVHLVMEDSDMQKIFLVFMLCFGLVACGTPPTPMAPRTGFAVVGMSGASPNSSDWYLFGRNPGAAYFGKRGERPADSLVASVIAVQVPGFDDDRSFLQYVAQKKAINDNPARFSQLKFKNQQVTFKGARCLRFNSIAQDLRPPRDAVGSQYLKIIGYFCRHPQQGDLGIDISVSERSATSGVPASLTKAGNEFFDAVRFNNNGL